MTNSSAIGRLLEEISWEGRKIRRFRHGGRGDENTLTAEVFMLLDFLPRKRFLAAVIRAATGADLAREQFATEVDTAEVRLLPGDVELPPAGIKVQPDAFLNSDTCSVLIEAKRAKGAGFKPEQLAREYLALLHESSDRTPLLLLVLGAPPPVTVKGYGRMAPDAAVELHLPALLERLGRPPSEAKELIDGLPDRLAWLTWDQIRATVEAALPPFDSTGEAGTIFRLGNALVRAVNWHS